jgi:hypothetical protein
MLALGRNLVLEPSFIRLLDNVTTLLTQTTRP